MKKIRIGIFSPDFPTRAKLAAMSVNHVTDFAWSGRYPSWIETSLDCENRAPTHVVVLDLRNAEHHDALEKRVESYPSVKWLGFGEGDLAGLSGKIPVNATEEEFQALVTSVV